uniref:Beta-glucanase n=1 Tax=Solanum tuberosum TaxID=4113 RepID=M1BXH8_SOLTU
MIPITITLGECGWILRETPYKLMGEVFYMIRGQKCIIGMESIKMGQHIMLTKMEQHEEFCAPPLFFQSVYTCELVLEQGGRNGGTCPEYCVIKMCHEGLKVDVIGVGCYSSKDLWTWKNEGIVLAAEERNETHDLYKLNVLERPKVIYNEKTGKYVMWMHIDDTNYTKASTGVAISDLPTGPFNYLYSKRPHGYESRDMTLFKDDDGVAYLVYSSEDNSELHIGPLNEEYMDVTQSMRRILVGQHREAPALFKHEGTYYMITSGCTGWAPNEALAHAAESIMGPWETIGNPCIGGNKVFRETTFFAQSTFVLPLPELHGSFIFMADRWNPADLKDSRYVWLPLRVSGPVDQPLQYNFGFPLWSRVSVYWHKRWRLPYRWQEIN